MNRKEALPLFLVKLGDDENRLAPHTELSEYCHGQLSFARWQPVCLEIM